MKEERIASYQRISNGKDIDESLAVERLILGKYAKDEDIEFVENYVDIHKSTNEDRPEFNRLIKDIFLGEIDKLVVVGGCDRLSRDIYEIDQIENYVNVEYIIPKVEYIIPKVDYGFEYEN